MRGLAALSTLVTLLCTACVVGQRPLVIPEGDAPTVMVLTTRLGGPLVRIARHPWIAMRGAGEDRWEMVEVLYAGRGSDTVQHRSGKDPRVPAFGDGVRLHAVFRGGEAQQMIDCVRKRAPEYPYRYEYLVYPGPNSNTFIDWLLRECDIPVDLPSTAVGKDYRGLIEVGFTSGGTGIQLETPLVGIALGLTEGVRVHLFSLEVGIDLWPPAIIVPVGEGRIGFADR